MSTSIQLYTQKFPRIRLLKKVPCFLIMTIFLFAGSQWGFTQDIENIKDAEPVKFNGSVGTQTTIYSISGNNNRMNPFHFGLHANFNLSFYEVVDLPIRISYNRFGLDVDKPHFQMGISPKYKWIQLHLGSRNMNFNSYTLSGHTFWGIGFDLTPGKWRISAMSGRLRERVFLDTRTGNELIIPQFQRTGRGGKIGYGTANNHFDLILFKAEDDPESLPAWQDSSYQNSLPGKTGRLSPEENLVVGINAKFMLFSSIRFFIEAGGSLFTRDQTNEIMESHSLYELKSSTTFKWAGKTGLGFPLGKFYFNGTYERIMPDYFSMGIYNFVNDMENLTGTLSGSIFQNKLIFSLMAGNQRNNLTGNRSETTTRFISNINATIMPQPHYGLILAYSNFNFSQKPEAIVLEDELLIKQVNKSYTLMPYYNLVIDTALSHQFNLAIIAQEVNDLNPVTRDFGNLQTRILTLGYSMTQSSGWSLHAGLNHTQLNSALIENRQMGVSFGASKSIFKKDWNFNFGTQINSSAVDGNSDGSLINANAGLTYTLNGKHAFRLNTNMLKSNSKAFDSYTEYMGQLGYSYSIR